MQADKALRYLQDRPDTWIPITQDETLEAIRELRKQGHDVSQRFVDGVREAKYTPPQMTLDMVAEAVKAFGAENILMAAPSVDPAMVDAAVEQIRQKNLEAKCLHPSEARMWRSDVDVEEPVCQDCGEVIPVYMMGGRQNGIQDKTQAALDQMAAYASTPGQAGRTNPMRKVEDPKTGIVRYEVAMSPCPECGENMAVYEDHCRTSRIHKAWANGGVLPDEVGTEPAMEVKDEPVYAFAIDWDRTKMPADFGAVVTCPRCLGKLRPRRQTSKGGVKEWVEADTFCHDPDRRRRDERCIQCNGHGLVPNRGTVATALLGQEPRMADPG